MKDKNYLVDTNVVIHFPSVFQNIQNIHVHLRTVEELDRLKESENPELAYRARKGEKLIAHNLEKIIIEREDYRQEKVDDSLLHCAKKKKLILITNDLTLRLKCNFNKVECEPYTNGEKSIYFGFQKIFITNENEIQSYLENQDLIDSLYQNQFVIFENTNESIQHTDGSCGYNSPKQYIKKGDKLELVKDYYIKNVFYNKIEPRNTEQKCFFHALFDKDINILVATGNFGTGKSFISINYAFQQLERGKINKIVYVPNNAITANSREVAALPGDLLEKEIIYMGSLVDIVGYDEIEKRVKDGTLELMPISLARGRNIEDAIILVNEAQNLTEEHIKLLIGRIGENTKIIFDGDVFQTDKPVFRNSNGLKLLYKIKNSEFADLFATVRFNTIERSRTARVSIFLDSID